MSALLVDLGNTRWKAALSAGGEIGLVESGVHADVQAFRGFLVRNAVGVERVLVASVTGDSVEQAVESEVRRCLGLPCQMIKSTDRMPNIVSGYRKPEQLGVDRLLAMVAARANSSAPLCVIDAGTAVTMDFVDASGLHLGGFILPGLQMYRDCLLANTAIPRDSDVHVSDPLGRDTPTAVALGARYSIAAIVETFLTGSRALFVDQRAEIFVGGGDADQLTGLLPSPCIKLENLVLNGLAALAAGGDV